MLKKSLSKMLFIGIGFLLFGVVSAGVGVFVWFTQNLQPFDTTATANVQFVIPKGQAIQIIAKRLQEEKLIKSTFAFRYLIWQGKLDSKIQAGSFELVASMSPREIAQKLTSGSNDIWVTIPEGKRVEEVAELFKEFTEFDPKEFVTISKKEEGYLFPDTYLFPAQATAQNVHDVMRKRFDQVVKENDLEAKIKKNGATLKGVVVMASILEREAQSSEDMKVVSGILYNRMQNGMALQVDATMQYVKGYDSKAKTWWQPALSEDKKLKSPFNTYLVTGLPPAPIANPGLKALVAATEPTPSDYLYYITDNDGVMHYAKTYEEHLKNVNQYLN